MDFWEVGSWALLLGFGGFFLVDDVFRVGMFLSGCFFLCREFLVLVGVLDFWGLGLEVVFSRVRLVVFEVLEVLVMWVWLCGVFRGICED